MRILNWLKNYIRKTNTALLFLYLKTIAQGATPYSKLPISTQLEAKYYTIVCGLRLEEISAENAAIEFIDLEHNTPRIQMLSFHLGEYYYRKQKFIRRWLIMKKQALII